MFQSCSNLELIDVASFDISKVTDMGMMFNDCPKLATICCFNDWSSSAAQSGYMFTGCTSLAGDKGTAFNSSFTDATYARPDGGTGALGYFTSETMTGIKTLSGSPLKGEDIYDLSGRKLAAPQKGINITHCSDGTSKKVLLKYDCSQNLEGHKRLRADVREVTKGSDSTALVESHRQCSGHSCASQFCSVSAMSSAT